MPTPLFPYQKEGVRFLTERKRAGLFDEMGLGKTAIAISALDAIRAQRVLIICPAMLRENWIVEFRKFSVFERRIAKGSSIHEFVAWSKGRYDILVTSYELAARWAKMVHEQCRAIDVIIIDESHYLKNTDSARTKAILGPTCSGEDGITMWAERTWLLTGTPMANDPVDIYPALRFCGAVHGTKAAFVRKYMYSRGMTYGSRQTPRLETVSELREKLSAMSIRRNKAGVGLQIPPIFFTSLTVDGDTREVLEMLRQHPGLEDAVIKAINQGGLSFLDAQYLSTLRRLVGESKAVPYAAILADELRQTDEKVVVMGLHRRALRDVQGLLAKEGFRAVLVNGDTPEKDRIAAVRSFQEDPLCRAFIGNMRAAGTGITLTASARVDMLETDWAPAPNAQAIMRLHRIGQAREVRARFISLARSIDEAVTAVVADKTRAIATVEGEANVALPAA